jgi:hypothetical protein
VIVKDVKVFNGKAAIEIISLENQVVEQKSAGTERVVVLSVEDEPEIPVENSVK